MEITKLKLPIYGSRLWIVIDKSFHRSIDMIEDQINCKVIEPEEIGMIGAYTFASYPEDSIYRMIVFLKPNTTAGDIAHEAKHVVNLAFINHGVKLSLHNDEHECYMLGWIVDRIHSALDRYKKKKDLVK